MNIYKIIFYIQELIWRVELVTELSMIAPYKVCFTVKDKQYHTVYCYINAREDQRNLIEQIWKSAILNYLRERTLTWADEE